MPRKVKEDRDLSLSIKTDSRIIANIYLYLEKRTRHIHTSKSELVHIALEMLEQMLLMSGKLVRRLKQPEAQRILQNAFPDLEIRLAQDKNNIMAELDEEADAIRDAMEKLEG